MKIAIVGAGKLGNKLAKALLSGNQSITVIDVNEDRLQKMSSQMDIMTITGNAKEISLLKEMDIDTYDYLIAATSRDEMNMTIATFAKSLGCNIVMARVRDPEHVTQLDFIKKTLSIDYILNPDLAISDEIYKYLVNKYSLTNGIFGSGKTRILEFSAKKIPSLIDKTVSEFPSLFPNMLIVAITRKGKVIIPNGQETISEDDIIYIIGTVREVQRLHEKVYEKKKNFDIQKAMIIGGGKTGYYLADKMSKKGIAVKIIERDLNRCRYLAEKLENVLVLHGDGTDADLLIEENIDVMNAFITVTGYDEDNLLLALNAKRRGVDDVIAKVSRDIYTDLVSHLGVDIAINPLDIVTSNVAKLIQGKKKVISNQVILGQAEITEIFAHNSMKITNIPIMDLDLPKGVIIGSIQRGENLIIPKGNAIIKGGDRITIFSLLSSVPEMAAFTRMPDRS